MRELGRVLIAFGVVIMAVGVALSFADKLPNFPWIGRLPGDFYIKRDHFSFYFPLTTSLLVSIALTLLLYLFRR
ncbi:MAG TPA: DUF2905 domain-containing protein [Candidatus Kryptonia bacterium]|nr:DUF2905 domain-containing protein [Candidatus Kryptonia bacterium]